MRVNGFAFLAVLALALPAPARDKHPTAAEFNKALEDLLAGKTDRKQYHLSVHWAGKTGGRSAEVYGSGAGVYNRDQQFKLKEEQVNDLLQLIKKSNFADLKPGYGGLGRGGDGPQRGAPERILGGVSVRVGTLTRGSSQLAGGEQSEALAKLAEGLLDICEQAAKKQAVTAANLADGLKKVADGELVPETFSVLVHRLGERPTDKVEGYLMRVEGRTVSTRTNTPGKGYGPVHKLDLTEKEMGELLKAIADADPSSFPVNLWAPTYTDFNVRVLKFEKNLQARQFAKMTPETHGEKQKRFDKLYESLQKLHERALKDGKPVKEEQQ